MKGLDGNKGLVYVGTGYVFNRQTLYGYDPPVSEKWPRKKSKAKKRIQGYVWPYGGLTEGTNPGSLIKEVIYVISCRYEEKTKWDKEIGWIYGSVTEDILTGSRCIVEDGEWYSIDDWWRNEQFWVIGGVSANHFAVFRGLFKVLVGVDTNFTVTTKVADDAEFGKLYLFKWTTLLIPPITLIIQIW
ncbi:unnamed protein product [Fraxinus pennsylvanica]|uniref:Uncharacterized protein n=1 Tax=Fraxinus pennsylvanica TaxID=56036 RepID=A0AAD1ZZF4_9LAMI|nr:unnamed protein product [Fraxinus pennsylvanica]